MTNIPLVVAASLWLFVGANFVTGLQSITKEVPKKHFLETLTQISMHVAAALDKYSPGVKDVDFTKQANTMLQSIVNDGIPSLNVPPLDPLDLPGNLTLDMPPLPGVVEMEVSEFANIIVTNLKAAYFALFSVGAILPPMKLNLDLQVPQIKVQGEWYNFTGTIGDLIPFYGFGDFELSASLGIPLTASIVTNNQQILQFSEVSVDLELHELTTSFSNLMGGGDYGTLFNELISENAHEILDMLKPVYLPDINNLIKTFVNDLLLENKITAGKLIECILNPEKCFSKKKYLGLLFPIRGKC